MKKPLDPAEQKALDNIAEYGCHVIHVFEEVDSPPFSYSVGIQKSSGAPEVIVIGLKRELAHFMVNDYSSRARKGEIFQPGGLYSGFLEGFDVCFANVDTSHYRDYLGWDLWLYDGDDFNTMQIIYPTTSGVWPWDSAASDWFKKRQPLLGRIDEGSVN